MTSIRCYGHFLVHRNWKCRCCYCWAARGSETARCGEHRSCSRCISSWGKKNGRWNSSSKRCRWRSRMWKQSMVKKSWRKLLKARTREGKVEEWKAWKNGHNGTSSERSASQTLVTNSLSQGHTEAGWRCECYVTHWNNPFPTILENYSRIIYMAWYGTSRCRRLAPPKLHAC